MNDSRRTACLGKRILMGELWICNPKFEMLVSSSSMLKDGICTSPFKEDVKIFISPFILLQSQTPWGLCVLIWLTQCVMFCRFTLFQLINKELISEPWTICSTKSHVTKSPQTATCLCNPQYEGQFLAWLLLTLIQWDPQQWKSPGQKKTGPKSFGFSHHWAYKGSYCRTQGLTYPADFWSV